MSKPRKGRLSIPSSFAFLRVSLRVLCVSVVGLFLLACDTLNPALRYEEAARQLRFSLDRVEPQVELAFPLEQSRLRLKLDIAVDNPSDQRLRTRRVGGSLYLKAREVEHALGAVAFPEGADIAPRGRSTLRVEVSFGYGDLKAAWAPLSAAVFHHERATWRLDGQARFEILGIEFGVPLRVSKGSGG